MKLPKPRAYPKKIYFASECYRVRFKKGLNCYGKTDSNKKTVTIKHGMSERETLATFVHECLHVIEFETPLKIKHKMVYELEKAIVEMLLDNFL